VLVDAEDRAAVLIDQDEFVHQESRHLARREPAIVLGLVERDAAAAAVEASGRVGARHEAHQIGRAFENARQGRLRIGLEPDASALGVRHVEIPLIEHPGGQRLIRVADQCYLDSSGRLEVVSGVSMSAVVRLAARL
jgi:hypothetical protein